MGGGLRGEGASGDRLVRRGSATLGLKLIKSVWGSSKSRGANIDISY